MADFCNQCATELVFEPGDLEGLCGANSVASVLCEECGPTWVDSKGTCRGPCNVKLHWDEIALSTRDGDFKTNKVMKKKWENAE